MRLPLPLRFLRSLSTSSVRPLAARIPVPTAATLTPTATPTSRRKPVTVAPLTAPTTAPCACDPSGLDIDRDTPLLGTMPRYSTHVVVSTGRNDWSSRIEFDASAAAAVLKRLLRGGDPWRPSLVTNSSLSAEASTPGEGSIHIFPAGYYIPRLPLPPSPAALALLTDPGSAATSDIHHHHHLLLRRVRTPTILICSHHTRDARCGAYFPPLAAEFRRVLREKAIEATVAGSSHLGGHKWAGNVVVYLPAKEEGEEAERADGWGVWYGRVGVKEVQAIVEETVVGGRVVDGICRGVVGRVIEPTEAVDIAGK